MPLSTDLISQFVKATKDTSKSKKETTVYGTIVKDNKGGTFVKLDGSNTLTPVSNSANAVTNDRVIVMIKNHTATVTGNLTSPAARYVTNADGTKSVEDINLDTIKDFEIIVADKADIADLEVERGRIDELVADNIQIRDELTAAEASIEELRTDDLTAIHARIDDLDTSKLDAGVANIKYAKIEELKSTEASLHTLESTYADFASATADRLEANEGNIKKLQAEKAEVADLTAAVGDIALLGADMADINTLIFGSATGDTIHSSFANAVIAQLGNAQIKSAMIDSLSADKVTAGDLITDNVRVKSENGLLLISDETIQISDGARVRVQVGKDASNDYSINIWDAEGNLMFSKGGITDSAIKDAIIRNDMVSDTANIAAHKLDINSLFEEINGSSKTIKSTRVSLDDEGQTLDVEFGKLVTETDNLSTEVTSQGTRLSAVEGDIKSEIWKQDIAEAVDDVEGDISNLSTQYSAIEQTVNSMSSTVAEHTSEIAEKADSSTVTSINNKVTSIEQNLTGFQTTVRETYTTKTEFENLEIGGKNLYVGTKEFSPGKWITSNGTIDGFDSNGNARAKQGQWSGWSQIIPVKAGEKYTLSALVTGDGAAKIRFNAKLYTIKVTWLDATYLVADGVTPGSKNYGIASTTESKYSATVTVNVDGYLVMYFDNIIADSYLWVSSLKMEKGTKATDWTPALEDSFGYQYYAAITIHGDPNTYYPVVLRGGDQYVMRDIMVTRSYNDSAPSEWNGHPTSKGISLLLKIKCNYGGWGGANYSWVIKDFEEMYGNVFAGAGWCMSNMGFELFLRGGGDTGAKYKLYSDQPITNTFYGGNSPMICYNQEQIASIGSNVWYASAPRILTDAIKAEINGKRYASEKDLTTAENQISQNTANITSITSRVATAETSIVQNSEAIELRATKTEVEEEFSNTLDLIDDVDVRVTTSETLIKQLSDSISMLVTDGNGTSLMTQTEEGWTFSTSEIQSSINDASEKLNDLTNEVGDVNSTVDVLQQAINDLGTIAEYVKIGTYEGEPCIELGEGDSDFKLLITNTRIMFREGSGVPAYFNNQSMHIKKAVIEEELQQGGFVWKSRSNGNMGLVWKGVIS